MPIAKGLGWLKQSHWDPNSIPRNAPCRTCLEIIWCVKRHSLLHVTIMASQRGTPCKIYEHQKEWHAWEQDQIQKIRWHVLEKMLKIKEEPPATLFHTGAPVSHTVFHKLSHVRPAKHKWLGAQGEPLRTVTQLSIMQSRILFEEGILWISFEILATRHVPTVWNDPVILEVPPSQDLLYSHQTRRA